MSVDLVPLCAICLGPVEDEERNWIEGFGGERFYLCNFHRQPIRDGAAWVTVESGRNGVKRRVLKFKEPIVVNRFPV